MSSFVKGLFCGFVLAISVMVAILAYRDWVQDNAISDHKTVLTQDSDDVNAEISSEEAESLLEGGPEIPDDPQPVAPPPAPTEAAPQPPPPPAPVVNSPVVPVPVAPVEKPISNEQKQKESIRKLEEKKQKNLKDKKDIKNKTKKKKT